MREIAYKHLTSPKHRRKIISVCERNDTEECLTTSHKRFVYIIDYTAEPQTEVPKPEFYIGKVHDARQKREKFSFRVKGILFITRDNQTFRVRYSHSLLVNIDWKTKLPCPSPTA